MGWGIGNVGGGSGGGLNFNVVGNPQPSNPKENTIWVETDMAISSYIFSATEPAEPVEGMVWITTGTSSPVEFNALKKNAIQVYPMSAKQCVDGALVDVTAMSYQDGEWVEWYTYLYNKGNEHKYITGGWSAFVGYGGNNYHLGKFTKNDASFTMQHDGTQGSCVSCGTKNKIDLTNVSTIRVNRIGGTVGAEIMVTAERSVYSYQNAVAKGIISSTENTGEVDVSGITGSYYIALTIQSWAVSSSYVEINEVSIT